MRMSESYATTVAAVAPVIILVAAFELTTHRARIREIYVRAARGREAVDALYADGATPTREQIQQTERELEALRNGEWRLLGMAVYLLLSNVLAALLCSAEFYALGWLVKEDPGPSPGVALFCFVALVIGFVWVGVTPLAWLVVSVLPLLGPLRSNPNQVRYKQAVADLAPEAEGSGREPMIPEPPLPARDDVGPGGAAPGR
ncbi:hypothetical protein ACFWRV_06690 [Streptomyces sp. NPDC058576]|uniref:hypothetical protein n=1 Tax=Streptomyces sp. NPDC058576 TaxID=3346547 RepID=UPI00365AEF86